MNIDPRTLISRIVQDKKKSILAIIVGFVILFLDFSLVLKPQVAAVKAINTKIVKIRNDLNSLKIDMAKMQTSLNKASSSKIKKVISEDQKSLLIEEIYKLGSQNNIKILQIRPAKEEKSKTPVVTAGILPLLLDVDLSCGYYQLVRFLSAIENDNILMSVNELDIVGNKKNILSHQVKLSLMTYVSKR